MPARNNSLFFAGCVNFWLRSFNTSITAYSDFGMVKLSRTSLGFFVLAALVATCAVLLLEVVLACVGVLVLRGAAGLVVGRVVFLTGVAFLAVALRTGVLRVAVDVLSLIHI